MVSKLMTAKQAKELYEFPSMTVHGKSIQLNNTDGKSVVVAADQLVYMRGKGNFGIYGDDRDANRKSQGYDMSSHIGKVGTGDHRHETDLKGSSHSTKRVPFTGRVDTIDKFRVLQRQNRAIKKSERQDRSIFD